MHESIREDMARQFRNLARETEAVCPDAAIVLFVLSGAILSDSEREFAKYVMVWSRKRKAQLEQDLKDLKSQAEAN